MFSVRAVAVLAVMLPLVAGCTKANSADRFPSTGAPSSLVPLPTALASQANHYCDLANQAAPYEPPTDHTALLRSIERRISADTSMLAALTAMKAEPGWDSLNAGFIKPLTAEISSLKPIVTKLDAAAQAGDDKGFSAQLNNFQSTSTSVEPAIDAYVSANGLTNCQLG